MSQDILKLASRAATHASLAGGKAANLALLLRYGFKVPSGFVISARTFPVILSHITETARKKDPLWSLEYFKSLPQKHLAIDLPSSLLKKLTAALRRIEGPVAVRSSLVGEDSAHRSFAGQLDSFLNVEGIDETVEAVKKCYASLLNFRFMHYIREQEEDAGSDFHTLSMAVILQRMVDARVAGVAFSADPNSGRRCVIIEAAEGSGEKVADGTIAPDRYIIDENGKLLEKAAAGAAETVLSEAEILILAGKIRDIAAKMGSPQDVEWAWDGRTFYFLQSRPITSLADAHIYSHKLVADMSPGLVKPLLWSTNSLSMSKNVLGRLFSALIGPNDIDFTKSVKRIHSRIYADMTFFGALLTRLGLPGNFFEVISRDEKAGKWHPRLNRTLARTIVLHVIPFLWRYARFSGELRLFLTRQHGDLEFYRRADWTDLPCTRLFAHFAHLITLHGKSQWHIFICALNMTIRNKILQKITEKRAPQVLSSDLIRGLVGLKGLEPNAEIQSLARLARALPEETVALFFESDDAAIRGALSASPHGRSLTDGVDAFMRRYGFLSTNSIDYSVKPWIENPGIIWAAIGTSSRREQTTDVEAVDKIRNAAKAQVEMNLNRLQKPLFGRLLSQTITYIDIRERISLLLSEDAYQMRRLVLAMAEYFTAAGELSERDDIFYLYYDELKALVRGEADVQDLGIAIARRKQEMEEDARIEIEHTVCGEVLQRRRSAPPAGQEYLSGIGGSSGVARGYAYVVSDPSQVNTALSKEDILVVPFTDVGWTPLFSSVGGIIAESGGQLSHSAIIAREYGLPAVVNVKNALNLIENRAAITIDGTLGRVYLKHITL